MNKATEKERITSRRLQVVRCVVGKGLSCKMAALELKLSTHTVYNHLKVVYRVLGIHSVSELSLIYHTEPEKLGVRQARILSMFSEQHKKTA